MFFFVRVSIKKFILSFPILVFIFYFLTSSVLLVLVLLKACLSVLLCLVSALFDFKCSIECILVWVSFPATRFMRERCKTVSPWQIVRWKESSFLGRFLVFGCLFFFPFFFHFVMRSNTLNPFYNRKTNVFLLLLGHWRNFWIRNVVFEQIWSCAMRKDCDSISALWNHSESNWDHYTLRG